MGRKKKKQIEEHLQEQSKKEVEDTVKKPKETPVSKQKYMLKEICKKSIHNFNDRWFPSIEAFAKSEGFIQPATEEQCKTLLKKWGAVLK